MADKFIIHGATYYGDGTSSAEATVNGGVGAWNNIDILTGTTPTYGALAAGDTVNIRSKTSAGADISITHATALSIGSTVGSDTDPVVWILDGGSIWSGVNGTLTIESALASATMLTGVNNNTFMAEVQDALIFTNTNIAANQNVFSSGLGTRYVGILFDYSYGTTGNGCGLSWGSAVFERCHFYLKRVTATGFLHLSYNYLTTVIDCDFHIAAGYVLTGGAIISASSRGGKIEFIGGRLRGDASLSGFLWAKNLSGGSGVVTFTGMDIPPEVTFTQPPVSLQTGGFISAVGLDGGGGGFLLTGFGQIDSRDDGYYPYLNAVLPNTAASGWSYKCFFDRCNATFPGRATLFKFSQLSSGVRTITLNLLIGDSFSGIGSAKCYMVVTYRSGGALKSKSSYDVANTALSSGSLGWSALTYGAVALSSYKLAITTPDSVDQDSPVSVEFFWGEPADVPSKLIFLCPDVQIA